MSDTTLPTDIPQPEFCDCTCVACKQTGKHSPHPCGDMEKKDESAEKPIEAKEAKKFAVDIEINPADFVATANKAMRDAEGLFANTAEMSNEQFDCLFEVFQQYYKCATAWRARRGVNTRLKISTEEYEKNKNIKHKSGNQLAEEKREAKQTKKIEKKVENRKTVKSVIPNFDPSTFFAAANLWCKVHNKPKAQCGCQ